MNLALKGTDPRIVAADRRRYEISDHFEVKTDSTFGKSLQIWCPIIADTPYQRVLDINVAAPQPWRMTREFEFGNVMLYGEYAGRFDQPLTFTIDYVVERLPVAATPDPSHARSLQTPQFFARALGLEQ